MDVLADAAILQRSRKRGRLDTYSPGKIKQLPVDLSNRGIERMLQMNRARFNLHEELSVLHVNFEGKRRSTKGRFKPTLEEEYPFMGLDVQELAEHIVSQGIYDVSTLAALYPAGFWNAVYLIGKDLETISETVFAPSNVQ